MILEENHWLNVYILAICSGSTRVPQSVSTLTVQRDTMHGAIDGLFKKNDVILSGTNLMGVIG